MGQERVEFGVCGFVGWQAVLLMYSFGTECLIVDRRHKVPFPERLHRRNKKDKKKK